MILVLRGFASRASKDPGLRRNPKSNGILSMVLPTDLPCPANPDPREDPKSRSLNGGSYKLPLVV